MLMIVGKVIKTGAEQILWSDSSTNGFNKFTLSLEEVASVENKKYFSISLVGKLYVNDIPEQPIGVSISSLELPVPWKEELDTMHNFPRDKYKELQTKLLSRLKTELLSLIAQKFVEEVHSRLLKARTELNKARKEDNTISINLEKILSQITVDVVRENGAEA